MFGVKINYLQQHFATVSASLALGSNAVLLFFLTGNGLIHLAINDLQIMDVLEKLSISTYTFVAVALFSGVILEKFGRKKPLLFISIPVLICWILFLAGNRIVLLEIAFFLTGLITPLTITGCICYITEISDKSIRGKLIMMSILVEVGVNAILTIILPYTGFLPIAIIGMLLQILFIATFFKMPESPYWLAKQGRENEAKEALKKTLSHAELSYIDNKLADIRDDLTQPILESKISFIKSIAIIIGLQIFEIWMCQTLLNNSLICILWINIRKSAYLPVEAVVLVPVLITSISAATMDKIGSKLILVTSLIGGTIATFLGGIYFLLTIQGTQNIEVIPLFYTLILAAAAVVMKGSIRVFQATFFPVKFLQYGISIAIFFYQLFVIIFSYVKTPNVDSCKLYAGMNHWITVAVAVVVIILALIFIPETKRKSFLEIQNMLNNKQSR